MRSLVYVVPLVLLAMTACSSTGPSLGRQAELEMKAGVDAAKHGYWHEAKFRFERAMELSGSDGELWNNLAVAHEALGEHDEARAAYDRAKELLPTSRHVSRNMARFDQFYSSYVAPPKPDEAGSKDATDATEAGKDSDDDEPADSDRS
jgi:tetratricopeptide (TPR) repeat protein